jgi:hypothetical protein
MQERHLRAPANPSGGQSAPALGRHTFGGVRYRLRVMQQTCFCPFALASPLQRVEGGSRVAAHDRQRGHASRAEGYHARLAQPPTVASTGRWGAATSTSFRRAAGRGLGIEGAGAHCRFWDWGPGVRHRASARIDHAQSNKNPPTCVQRSYEIGPGMKRVTVAAAALPLPRRLPGLPTPTGRHWQRRPVAPSTQGPRRLLPQGRNPAVTACG